MTAPILIDLADMPHFNGAVGSHGLRSVSEGKVFWGGVNKVSCTQHGAMNAVDPDCTIWRCLTCHEGAYLPPRGHKESSS